MKLAILCAAATVLVLLFLLWCMTQIHFRVGSRHLKVLLFGIPIRRISLADIAYVSKREPKGIAERWYSTMNPSHRLLTIERKTGLRKYFCITPHNRYVFLADLKSAVRRIDPTAEWAAFKIFEDSTTLYPQSIDSDEPANRNDPAGTPSAAAEKPA
jgi:hypothetical protein